MLLRRYVISLCYSGGMLFLYVRDIEIGQLYSWCLCEFSKDRDSHTSSVSKDKPTFVAISNRGSSKEEESISYEDNRSIPSSDKDGILLKLVCYKIFTTADKNISPRPNGLA